MPAKALDLDANIPIRAVLGKRVREVIETYCDEVSFFVPEAADAEAEEYLPLLISGRGGNPESALVLLHSLRHLVELIGHEFESEARERLGKRDPDDWPLVASALALQCPIWTEDTDFFGCGVATWTSDRVRLYLRQ